jgi:hypothetical protein
MRRTHLLLLALCAALACGLARERRASAQTGAPARPSPEGKPPKWDALSPADRVKALEALTPSSEYTCVMHADVRHAQEGVCPKCGMPLVAVGPSVRAAYRLETTAAPARPKPGERVRLRFLVHHPETGAPVSQFVLNHERLYHLFVVSQDLGEYQHVHPQPGPDGSFTVELTLPREGLYRLHSDFFPAGGTPQLIHGELATAGHDARRPAPPPRLVPDATLVKTADGLRVTLDTGGPVAAGVYVPLRFTLADARTGRPVRDLEPYLGAWGHTLLLNADQSEYLHTHPTEMLPAGADPAEARGGPSVEFGAMFPAPGPYRLWTQFQRAGKVTTVSFTLRVN